jgi:virulence-associated protein VapD
MYAIAYDLIVKEVKIHHKKGIAQAYIEIGATLAEYGFRRIQGSLYVTENENMNELFKAIYALKSKEWFRLSVRDIRAFRIEQWSDFTDSMKINK